MGINIYMHMSLHVTVRVFVEAWNFTLKSHQIDIRACWDSDKSLVGPLCAEVIPWSVPLSWRLMGSNFSPSTQLLGPKQYLVPGSLINRLNKSSSFFVRLSNFQTLDQFTAFNGRRALYIGIFIPRQVNHWMHVVIEINHHSWSILIYFPHLYNLLCNERSDIAIRHYSLGAKERLENMGP